MIFRVEIDILLTKTVYSYGATNQKTAVIPNFRVESVVLLTEAVYAYGEPCQKTAVYTENYPLWEKP